MKLLVSIGIVFVSVLLLLFLWKQSLMLSVLLLLLAFIKHKLYPIQKEFIWFMMVCVGSAIVEIVFVNSIHAWSYSGSHLLGVPIWMPLFWGLIGTTSIVIYDGIIKK